jgi:hypothetical protein
MTNIPGCMEFFYSEWFWGEQNTLLNASGAVSTITPERRSVNAKGSVNALQS